MCSGALDSTSCALGASRCGVRREKKLEAFGIFLHVHGEIKVIKKTVLC